MADNEPITEKKSSEPIKNAGPEFASALVKFQAAIPTIKKTQTAKVQMNKGGSYSYQFADLGDIWEAIRTPLANAGLAVTQMLSDGRDGKTVLETTIWHESGQFHSRSLDLDTKQCTPQEAGSLFTYYKRYALSSALGISTEKDEDGKLATDAQEDKPRASTTKPASQKQLDLLKVKLFALGYVKEVVDQRLKLIESSAQASEAIDKAQQMIDQKEKS